jgi:parvulin-like peptidyl-prolyl isomerase
LLLLVIFQIALCGWPRSIWSAPQDASPQTTQSAPVKRIVITVGNEQITATQVEEFIQALPPRYRAFYGGPGKHLLPQYIARTKILAAEAVKEKLEEQPEVARALEAARESILADAAQKHFEQSVTVSDPELQELYKKDKAQSQEVHIKHILIRTKDAPAEPDNPSHPALPEPEARKKLEDIRKRILAGADFAQMAKQYSEDDATAASGGDMGFIKYGQVVPPITDAAYSLEPGQVSDIITTPYGLEIIKVEEKHIRPFEEVRPALESELRRSKATELIQHVSEQYHVYFDKEYFSGQPAKPAKATSPAPPPGH